MTVDSRFRSAFIFLFAFLFLAVPFYYQHNLGGYGLFTPFNNLVWILVTLIIALGILKVTQTREIKLSRMTLPLLLFLTVLTLLGFVYDVSPPVSWLFRILGIWAGVLLFISIQQFDFRSIDRDDLFLLILGGVSCQTLVSLIQLHMADNLPTWIPQSPNVPRGIFQQVNLEASFLATGLVIAGYLLGKSSIASRPWPVLLFIYLTTLSSSYVISQSGSRAGLFGALIGLSLLILFRFKPMIVKGYRYALPWFAAIALGVTVSHLYPSAALNNGLIKMEQGFSKDVRYMIYDSSLELFLENPFGYGIGQFEPVWHERKADYLEQHPDAPALQSRLSHPHNELLYWAIEGGIAGLAAILITALAFLWLLVKLGWQRGGSYFALLIPITLHTQVELPFYLSSLHWVLFVILIALAADYRKSSNIFHPSRMLKSSLNILAITLPICVIIFFVHSLVAGQKALQFQTTNPREFELLNIPTKNIYFREWAKERKMQALLQNALRSKNAKILESYIPWALEYLKQTPDIAIYSGLIQAYRALDDEEESKAMYAAATRIYPDHPALRPFEPILEYSGQVKSSNSVQPETQ